MLAALFLALTGGHLFIGSLSEVLKTFPGSPIQLDALAYWFGQEQFTSVTAIFLSAFEGLLFGAGVMGSMMWAAKKTQGT